MDTVNALFLQGLGLSQSGEANANVIVDLAQIGKVDSSAVSLILAWLRESKRNNATLNLANVPKNLISLLNLYGVAELLNLSAT